MKINESKSVHVVFTNRWIQGLPLKIENQQILTSTVVKYLGLHLNKKLTWKNYVNKKKEEIKLTTWKIHWLLGWKIHLSTSNKLLLYKTMVKPNLTYRLERWEKLNIAAIQRLQNKWLRNIVDTPWFMRNTQIHKDLKMCAVTEEVQYYMKK